MKKDCAAYNKQEEKYNDDEDIVNDGIILSKSLEEPYFGDCTEEESVSDYSKQSFDSYNKQEY